MINLNELCSVIRHAPDQFALFLGAGACVSAGLPLGDTLRELMLRTIYGASLTSEELARKFYADFPDATKYKELTLEVANHFILTKYGIACLEIIKGELERYDSPPLGYRELKELCSSKIFRKIVTVNFDELLEKALEELNPIIIGNTTEAASDLSTWQNNNKPVLLKLHGTLSDSRNMKAAVASVKILPEEKAEHLRFIFINNSIIFVGYSARDLDVLETIRPGFESPEQYGHKIFFVSPSLSASQKQLLNEARSNGNYLELESDIFFRRVKEIILGGDVTDSPMHQELVDRGLDVRGIVWTPGQNPYSEHYLDTVEVLIYVPNAVPARGAIKGDVGEKEHKIVIELSKKYYPQSRFWITYVFSDIDKPRCKIFHTSVPEFNFGGASLGEMLPSYLTKYLH